VKSKKKREKSVFLALLQKCLGIKATPKESIFLEITEKRFQLRNEMIHTLDDNMLVSEQIEYYVHWLLDSIGQDSVVSRYKFSFEFWTNISRQAEKRHLAKERYVKFEADLMALVQRGVDRGEFRTNLNVSVAVYNLLSAMDGMGFMSTVMGIEAKKESVDELVAMFLMYWKS
jgi:hypothetical protein